MKLSTFVRTLRHAYYTGSGVTRMKALVRNYNQHNNVSYKQNQRGAFHVELSKDPHIQFVSFSNVHQEATLPPGFVAIMDGRAILNNQRRLHKNETVVLAGEILVRSLDPRAVVLHVDLDLDPREVTTGGPSSHSRTTKQRPRTVLKPTPRWANWPNAASKQHRQ